jgi:hypothetical protein
MKCQQIQKGVETENCPQYWASIHNMKNLPWAGETNSEVMVLEEKDVGLEIACYNRTTKAGD